MTLQPLKIVKNWTEGTVNAERNWDEIADKVTAWAFRADNNFKQIGLDINGSDYEFNNIGRATQTSSLVSRLDALELTQSTVGFRNLGIDISTVGTITLTSANGTALSASNVGQVAFNSETTDGQVVTRSVSSNLSVALTGAHWGYGTKGDQTGVFLWIFLIDDNGTVVLGVSTQGGRDYMESDDTTTVATSASSQEKVLLNSALSAADGPTITLGWVRADFDDTGASGGEDFWTVSTTLGDLNMEKTLNLVEGTILF